MLCESTCEVMRGEERCVREEPALVRREFRLCARLRVEIAIAIVVPVISTKRYRTAGGIGQRAALVDRTPSGVC